MISSPTVKTLIEQNTTIQTNIGCTIEYNMNSMVDNITVVGTDYVRSSDNAKPYKKLFPASSVIKSFRPVGAGVKYAVFGDVGEHTWKNPKNIDYPLNFRTYYPGIDTYYKYWLSQKTVGANITITYPQAVLTNKIVVRFEISHSIPATWTVSKEGDAVLATGTSAAIKPFTTSGTKNYDAGTLTLYYNGTAWVTTEPSTISAPVSITALKLVTSGVSTPTRTAPEVSGSHVGVIELSPRWITDLTEHIVDFSISKESSTSADDILPVGKVSANSISMGLVSYEATRKIITYEKGTAFDATKLYMYKSVELKPYIKVYNSGSSYTDSKGSYEKVNQGTFYIDNWSTSEFGDISLDALDGAKYLQDIICPGMVCKDTSVAGIIRRLLDNVGFTNYNLNYRTEIENGKTVIRDDSILNPIYWWTDDGETVWNAIQELCRDSQMIATFDENNILQFYTRDYLFKQATTHWNFNYAKNGNILPDIMSFQKRDLPAVNQVKILWNPVTSSQLIGDGQPIWKSGTSYLGAYSLVQDIPASTSGGGANTEITLFPITVQDVKQIVYNFSGYLVIDSEIIEYDAIEYQYLDTQKTLQKLWITQVSDLQKIANDLYALESADKIIAQTGKVRVKTRGAFGTSAVAHAKTGSITGWSGFDNTLRSSSENLQGTSTPSSVTNNTASLPSLDKMPPESESKDPDVGTKLIQKSLLQITALGSEREQSKQYSVAVKDMQINTSGNYYNFGTGLFFKGSEKNTRGSGGIAFFTSANGLDGYYIKLETTSNQPESGSDKPLSIFKVKNGVITNLQDSQTDKTKSLAYLSQGVSYKVDVRVQVKESAVVIDARINNFKVTAVDSVDALSKTSNIAVFSNSNSTFFDYVHAIPLNEKQYSEGIISDQYSGRFGSTTLDFLYGEKLSSGSDNSAIPSGTVDEFGTVARELLKVSIKYDSRPAFPIITSLGLNQFVELIGYRLTSFGAEVYVLNNAGTFVPLDDSRFASFSVIGNTIVQSGQNEYLDKTINEFTVPEQVTFESIWIQREEDARSLSKFIKEQWSKKQSVCELEIFSNPLISVGDIVTINYPSNGLDGTQKFMVSSINNSFDGGLSTKITTRSIYSL